MRERERERDIYIYMPRSVGKKTWNTTNVGPNNSVPRFGTYDLYLCWNMFKTQYIVIVCDRQEKCCL